MNTLSLGDNIFMEDSVGTVVAIVDNDGDERESVEECNLGNISAIVLDKGEDEYPRYLVLDVRNAEWEHLGAMH